MATLLKVLNNLADIKSGGVLHFASELRTRLIMFGKYAAERRHRLGKGRPETFDFLGFTHYCATSRDGKFIVKRKTQRKRKIRKLKELRIEARRRMHSPVAKQHEWLSAVLRGHFAYYGLPSNMRSMVGFAYEVRRLWLRVVGPAQSAWHDMGSVQPLDESLSVGASIVPSTQPRAARTTAGSLSPAPASPSSHRRVFS